MIRVFGLRFPHIDRANPPTPPQPRHAHGSTGGLWKEYDVAPDATCESHSVELPAGIITSIRFTQSHAPAFIVTNIWLSSHNWDGGEKKEKRFYLHEHRLGGDLPADLLVGDEFTGTFVEAGQIMRMEVVNVCGAAFHLHALVRMEF